MQSLFSSMNQLSNHDHSRFLSRTNRLCGAVAELDKTSADKNVDMAVMYEAILIQMTWPGSSTIYYGDEAGLCGFKDPDNRRTYQWGGENFTLIDIHRQLIRVRKNNPVLKFGSTIFLIEDAGVIVYARFDKENKIVVAITVMTIGAL